MNFISYLLEQLPEQIPRVNKWAAAGIGIGRGRDRQPGDPPRNCSQATVGRMSSDVPATKASDARVSVVASCDHELLTDLRLADLHL